MRLGLVLEACSRIGVMNERACYCSGGWNGLAPSMDGLARSTYPYSVEHLKWISQYPPMLVSAFFRGRFLCAFFGSSLSFWCEFPGIIIFKRQSDWTFAQFLFVHPRQSLNLYRLVYSSDVKCEFVQIVCSRWEIRVCIWIYTIILWMNGIWIPTEIFYYPKSWRSVIIRIVLIPAGLVCCQLE